MCHGLAFFGDGGSYVVTSSVKSNVSTQTVTGTSTFTTNPVITYYATSDPTRHVSMAGTISTKFTRIGTVTSGTRTYDLTFTNPDGTVFGTYKGSGTLSQTMVGSCANPL